MKRTLSYLLILIIGLLLGYYSSCLRGDQPPTSTDAIEDHLIEPETAKRWNELYRTSRYNVINESLGLTDEQLDNRSTWYSLEEIEQYIAYAKRRSHELGDNLTGFRLHLAVNPEVEVVNNQGVNVGQTTIFIAPTKSTETGKAGFLNFYDDHNEDNDDIEPLERGSAGDPPHDPYSGD